MSASPTTPFLKAVGLRFLSRPPRWFRGHGREHKTERPKILIETSIAVALKRLFIHILPVLASVAIISLNIGHLYLGRTIPGPELNNNVTFAILQVVAKIQELLIIASLATIVFEIIRNSTIHDGVPLGFLCSGFMFTQLSYLWSLEFRGALGSRMPLYAKLSTAGLLALMGLVAATAGPSTAVLLVPALQDWDAGGSEFYLQGTSADLFPNTMVALSSNSTPYCVGPDAVNYAFCPSSGFPSLSTYASNVNMIKNGANLGPPPTMIFGQFSIQTVDIASATIDIPASQLVGCIRGISCQTAVVAPHLPTLMYQAVLEGDWEQATSNIPWDASAIRGMSNAEYRYNYGLTVATSTRVPAVRTACSGGQNISAGATTISFPVMPEYSCWEETRSMSTSYLNDTPSPSIRITWTPLPSEFGAVSIGMILEMPWLNSGSSRVAIGCSIDARWAPGTVNGKQGGPNSSASSDIWGRSSGLDTPFRPPSNGSWSQIAFDNSWLEMLTPKGMHSISQTTASKNLTTLEAILANSEIAENDLPKAGDQTAQWNEVSMGSSNRTLFVEWMTSLLVADGLSRHGTDRELNTSGPVADWELANFRRQQDYDSRLLQGGQSLYPPADGPFTTLYMDITIQGLSYQAKTVTDYMAILVLLVHILLALCHTIYVLRRRRSSAAWDSIAEILVLAHSSCPSKNALLNTSAGIQNTETFGRMAVVRAIGHTAQSQDPADISIRHLELVFHEDDTASESDLLLPEEDSTSQVPAPASWPLVALERSGAISTSRPQSSGSSNSSLPLLPDIGRRHRHSSRASNMEFRGQRESRAPESMVVPDRLYS